MSSLEYIEYIEYSIIYINILYIGLIPFLSAFGPFILSSVCDAEFPSFLSEIKNLP